MTTRRTIGIIPVRYNSTRFPGKPLIDIAGKTMIRRVYEQASKSKLLSEIIVATDDERIANEVRSFNGQVRMTSPDHQSGTDRCAEVAKQFQDISAIVNIQGDEPFIAPSQIDSIVRNLEKDHVSITTLAKKMTTTSDLLNNSIVKVVFNNNRMALYFSRLPIPYCRDLPTEEWIRKETYYQHIGVYGYKRKTLLEIAQLSKGHLEQMESLEQLRWLENGYPIYVSLTDKLSFGIDTPEDWEKAKRMIENIIENGNSIKG